MIIGRKRAEKDGNGEGKERRMGKESRGGRAGKGRGGGEQRRRAGKGRGGPFSAHLSLVFCQSHCLHTVIHRTSLKESASFGLRQLYFFFIRRLMPISIYPLE